MVLGNNYSIQKRQRWQTNVPPLQAILMAMQMHWSNARGIAQCSMTRATSEASGFRHQVTTCLIWPQQLPGWQSTKQQWTNTPTLLAILMAITMQRYNTVCITWLKMFTAFLEAIGCRLWASICSDNIKRTTQRRFVCGILHGQITKKDHEVKGWHQLTIGVWHIKLTRST